MLLGTFNFALNILPLLRHHALYEEILNERADITYPRSVTLQTQSVQTLWVSGMWNTC